MKRISELALCLCCGLGMQAADAEVTAASTDFVYQVQRGDSLGQLATQLLDSPARWAEVAKEGLNK
jgi:hypothetical protein